MTSGWFLNQEGETDLPFLTKWGVGRRTERGDAGNVAHASNLSSLGQHPEGEGVLSRAQPAKAEGASHPAPHWEHAMGRALAGYPHISLG